MTIPKVRKNQLLLACVVAAFLYLLFTEIFERWSATLDSFAELRRKQEALLNPEDFARRRNVLIEKRNVLVASLAVALDEYEQNQIGVVKFLNASARSSKVLVRSLVPSEGKSLGQAREIGVKIDALTTYHQLGSFVGLIEDGPFRMKFTKLEMVSQKLGSSLLLVRAECGGKVFSSNLDVKQ